MTKQGVLFIVCGPSGVGKTSLCTALLERRPRLQISVSYTTRAPRPNERDGQAYHFVDVPTFLKMREERAFAEWAEVHGNYYGTAVEVIEEAWEQGRDLLFDIDYQGARQLKERFPNACSLLITPPDLQTLEHRLRNRGTDSDDVIARRLQVACHELSQYDLFDFIVENDEFSIALTAMQSIYDASRHSKHLHAARLQEMLGLE